MNVDSAVVFPVSDPDTGARSSSAFARTVVREALGQEADPALVPGEAAWRTEYPRAFRALVEAGLPSAAAAVDVARRGLASIHSQLAIEMSSAAEPAPVESVAGSQRSARRVRVPYGGAVLTGADLDRQLDDWIAGGVIEPSCADAVRTVAAHPDWLDLSDQSFVILGAGAEMGPVSSLLAWGAEVIAVDLPRPQTWERLRRLASAGAGRLHIIPADVTASPGDVARQIVERDLRGRSMVLGNYVYAPGSDHVRVAAAVDAVTARVLLERDDVSLSFLGTPTDVYAVPAEVVEAAHRRYERGGVLRRARPALHGLSRGRLAVPQYPGEYATAHALGQPGAPGADGPNPDTPGGITDGLVLQQGANYAFAKRIQRWRATVARAESVPTSFTVAPPSRTASVTSNRLLRAAYDGAHRFGVTIFDPATSNALMATLLVHDMRAPRKHAHPWQDEVDGAAHGGLWRQGYLPRSVLGMAVGLGARSLIGSGRRSIR